MIASVPTLFNRVRIGNFVRILRHDDKDDDDDYDDDDVQVYDGVMKNVALQSPLMQKIFFSAMSVSCDVLDHR